MSNRAAQWPAAAIFDCDGLLLDTAPAWRAAFRSALNGDGRSLGDLRLRALNGASVRGAARELGVASDRLRVHLEEALADVSPAPLPGAIALLDALRPSLRLGVATNGPPEIVTGLLRTAGLLAYFDHVVSAEDVPLEKPAPDVYLAACAALGTDPSDAIALEDSPIGVASARGAGLVVIYVPSDPSQSANADLRVRRLDDPALLSLIGLPATTHSDQEVQRRP